MSEIVGLKTAVILAILVPIGLLFFFELRSMWASSEARYRRNQAWANVAGIFVLSIASIVFGMGDRPVPSDPSPSPRFYLLDVLAKTLENISPAQIVYLLLAAMVWLGGMPTLIWFGRRVGMNYWQRNSLIGLLLIVSLYLGGLALDAGGRQ